MTYKDPRLGMARKYFTPLELSKLNKDQPKRTKETCEYEKNLVSGPDLEICKWCRHEKICKVNERLIKEASCNAT